MQFSIRKTVVLGLLSTVFAGQAQVKLERVAHDERLKLETLPYYSYGKGIGMTSPDSIFQMNIRFRIQNRMTYYQVEEEGDSYEGVIRRLRFRLDGFVGDPRFMYALQLSFAPGDTGDLEVGESYNIIRDAVVYYRPNKNWSFSFGQTKLPGNRQRINSSGALQLTDRSINNAKFTLDRDFGVQAYYTQAHADKFSYALKGAISTGDGRNSTNKDAGLALTGKVELFPLGTFGKDGTTFEGDFVREQTPKLLLSGAFSQNNHAIHTQGQLGDELFANRTMRSVLVDAMLKYKGWAAMSAYMSRSTSEDAKTYNPADLNDIRYAYTGSGFDYQLSYLFPSQYELTGRYSLQKVHEDIRQLTPHQKQYSIGVTKYFWEHTFKVQAEATLDRLDFYDGHSKDNFYLRFQVEMGI